MGSQQDRDAWLDMQRRQMQNPGTATTGSGGWGAMAAGLYAGAAGAMNVAGGLNVCGGLTIVASGTSSRTYTLPDGYAGSDFVIRAYPDTPTQVTVRVDPALKQQRLAEAMDRLKKVLAAVP